MTDAPQPGRLALDFTARSDRGLVRSNNEDSAVAAPNLLALADGMGGHAAGEVASELMITALYSLQNTMSQGVEIPRDQMPQMLADAMDDGNRDIAAHVEDNPALDGMGCTLSTLLFDGGSLGVCHVGDSRGYLLRDGELTQITKDDTFVQSLVDEGKLAPEDVSSHPQRSLILKALTGRPVEPTLELREARAGDRYMLCSDGLSDPVSFDTIRDVLRSGTPDDAASSLINLALRGGGPDNITVVVADVVDVDAAAAATEAGDAPTLTLPTGPVLAGAVNAAAPELPRPDTSAGRASAVQIIQRPAEAAGGSGTGTVADDGNGEAGGDGDDEGSDDDDGSGRGGSGRRGRKRGKRGRKGLYIALATVLVLVLVAGGAIWWVRDSLSQSYFVAVAASEDRPSPSTTTSEDAPPADASEDAAGDDADPSASGSAAPDASSEADATDDADAADSADADDATANAAPIIIYKGSPGSILGISTQSPYQEICLDENGGVNMLPSGSDDPCHRLSTADLTPAARGTLDNLPGDSYEEVQTQVRRLAEQTLPPCVTRDSGSDNGDNGDNNRSSSNSTSSLSDLTTPGVSCREVN